MRFLSAVVLLALVASSCIDEPTGPFDPPPPDIPLFDVSIPEGGGTYVLPPLPGDTAVEIHAMHSRSMILGSSGGRTVVWEHGVPRALPELDRASAVNLVRAVAGTVDDQAAVRWSDASVTVVGPLPGHMRSEATAIEWYGAVAGNSWPGPDSAGVRAFRWRDEVLAELPPLPGDETTTAAAVGRFGFVVGSSRDRETGRERIVVWDSLATPVYTGYDRSTHEALGIREFGRVLLTARSGAGAFWWHAYDSTVTPIPPPDGDMSHWAVAIAPQGTVLGKVETSDPLVPVRWGVWGAQGNLVAVNASPISECFHADGQYWVVCRSPMRDHPFYAFTDYENDDRLSDAAVTNLTPTSAGGTSVTLEWTEVGDGTGSPARYRIKYATPPIGWRSATVGCDRIGEQIGARISCVVGGLDPDTPYDFMLMSYRVEDGGWAPGARYSNVGVGQPVPGAPDPESPGVDDLRVVGATSSSLELRWTQVDDGAGGPAWYRVKYAEPPIDWKTATIGCDRTMEGTAIGADMSCVVERLEPDTAYEVLMMSFRDEDGVWADGRYSNPANGRTAPGS